MKSSRPLFFKVNLLLIAIAVCAFGASKNAFAQYSLSTSSFLGDAGGTDRIRGSRIMPDGTIVLAANIGTAAPGGLTPLLLNGATASSSGAILRLSADGRTVLSVTRVAAQVEDLAIDAAGNIYVAAFNGGSLKLNPNATSILWSKPGRTLRIDAASDGTAAVLVTPATDPDKSDAGAGTISVFDAAGVQLSSFAGKDNTLDVCIDPTSQTVTSIGWRQASAFDGSSTQPVQIAYLRGTSYAGVIKYTAYDWSTDQASPRFINRITNNMADTRGYRCAIGGDGKLYAAFEVAGGNHIFRYNGFDIVAGVQIAGGDRWHEFYNTRSEHKTFFGRYEAGTGAYILGQQITNRLENGAGNTLRVNTGTIAADAAGRVYIGGASAWGLPMPPHSLFTVRPNETTFNPYTSGYLGGTWLMVLSPDLRTRLYTTRLVTNGGLHSIDARSANGSTRIVFAGTTKSFTETYTQNALQMAAGGGAQDGWFSVIDGSVSRRTPGDYDGDGRADLGVFRPGERAWYLLRSTQGFTGLVFGLATDRLTPADFDGDGKTDIAVWRPSTGAWYWIRSSDNSIGIASFGANGDIPVPGDHDGDGKADLVVYRQGVWYILNSSNGQVPIVPFGLASDRPVPADFDGDGKADIAVYRDGVWFSIRSSDGGFATTQFGIAADKPVAADYDGDGKVDQAVYRNGVWYINRSTEGSYAVSFGIASDDPSPGDYDGDGKADIAVFRNGTWYILSIPTGSVSIQQFGTTGDEPLPSSYVF
jgi:hypothetical protein